MNLAVFTEGQQDRIDGHFIHSKEYLGYDEANKDAESDGKDRAAQREK